MTSNTGGYECDEKLFLSSTAGLVFLSAVLLVAISPNLAQARTLMEEGGCSEPDVCSPTRAERQARERQDYAPLAAPSWTDTYAQGWTEKQVQALTFPYFKANTTKPVFSLYDALGRPENLKIGGTFRSRIEGINNQFRPAPFPHSDVFAAFRTNIYAEYDTGHKVKIGGEVFDSRGYLQKPNSSTSTTEVNALELTQAYLNFDLSDETGNGSKSSITAGRFTKDMGSRRLVARNDFRNTINSFTGASFDWQGANKDKITLFWTMPHTRFPADAAGILDNAIVMDRENLDLQFYGGSYTFANVLGGTLELYGYGLREQDSGTGLRAVQTRNRRLFTPGFRLWRAPKPGQFDHEVEAIYQTGLARDTAAVTDTRDLNVSAYFFHVQAGYTFNTSWLPRLSVQYDQASGDSANPTTFTRFDTLFGARRWEYGPTSLYGAVQRSNLISPGVRLEITPSPIWDAFITYRPLFLENPTDSFGLTGVRDRSGRSGIFAGQQIETRLRYWLIPNAWLLDTGAVYLIKGRFLQDAPNAPPTGDTFYGYLQTSFFF
ncbi:alginate export family protein [Nitrobacter sp.]|uniref:alginate export family protein n=1 Tax=Nitrobacter sp. TaxID=29420 RepID=UPI0032202A48